MSTSPFKVSKLLRVAIPALLIAVWLGIGSFGGPIFGKIADVSSNDQATFLPASAESTKVNEELRKFQDRKTIPAIIVFGGQQRLTTEDLTRLRGLAGPVSSLPGVVKGGVSPPIPSQDGKAALLVVNIASDADTEIFTDRLKDVLDDARLPVGYKISGPVGFLQDLSGAFAGIDGLLLGVALAVVFIILLAVYRSPVLPFLVLINSMFALCGAILLVYYLAKMGVVTLNGQVQGILFILVIGAATDYALLFVARYREELMRHAETYQAVRASWKRSLEPILAAGGTVTAGLLCLLLSDLNSNKALGPVGAIGIVLAVIATLTFLPSLLMPWGRKVFWPRIPVLDTEATPEKRHYQAGGLWPRISRLVARKARPIWIVTAAVLLVASFGLTQLKAGGVPQSDLILGDSQARDGQDIINDHFPGGSGTPTQVIVPADKLAQAAGLVEADTGVAAVSAVAKDSPSGTVPLGKAASGLPPALASAKPTVVNGEALLQATLRDDADSRQAQDTIVRLRQALHRLDPVIRVGGASAVQLDTRTTAQRDRSLIIPVVLVVITLILMALLRSILAPLLLLFTTTLSFAAILGVSALVFNHVLGFPGADPSVVLFGFIFLVALGIDYNIFLMTRVREESLRLGTRKGVLVGLVATGSVITSAGIVLAATFAALAVIPILFLAQLAFIVAFGVLIDTTVVRSLLVPALVHDIGDKVWWPYRIRMIGSLSKVTRSRR